MKLFDLSGKTAVVGKDIAFDVAEAAIDGLHAHADLARGSRRRSPNLLPEPLILRAVVAELPRAVFSDRRELLMFATPLSQTTVAGRVRATW